MSAPVLSILTPAVPSRIRQIEQLSAKLAGQIGELPIEHLVLLDNKRRTVGGKRDALLRAARGKYVAFVDDDDDVAGAYVSELLRAADRDPDVITFEQFATVNGESAKVVFGLGNPNEGWKPGGVVLRNAWHVCAWRRSLAIQSSFPVSPDDPRSNYGEDWAFAAPLCGIPGLNAIHVPHVLHFYRHDEKLTEAPAPR